MCIKYAISKLIVTFFWGIAPKPLMGRVYGAPHHTTPPWHSDASRLPRLGTFGPLPYLTFECTAWFYGLSLDVSLQFSGVGKSVEAAERPVDKLAWSRCRDGLLSGESKLGADVCSADANQMSSSTLRPRPGIDCPTGDRLATIYDTSLVYAAVSSAGKDQWIIDGTRCASLRRSISKQAKLRQRKPRHTVDGAICVDDSENHQTEKCDPECSKALITGRKCVPDIYIYI